MSASCTAEEVKPFAIWVCMIERDREAEFGHQKPTRLNMRLGGFESGRLNFWL